MHPLCTAAPYSIDCVSVCEHVYCKDVVMSTSIVGILTHMSILLV